MGGMDEVENRFWAKVDKSGGAGACWPWIAGKTSRGYGAFKVRGRQVYAHRMALELAEGRPLEAGEFACHHCDNAPCVNPKHLYRGDATTNNRDTFRRGHQVYDAARRDRHSETLKVAYAEGRHSKPLTTHCSRGHLRTPENTRINNGNRHCRPCAAIRARARRAA